MHEQIALDVVVAALRGTITGSSAMVPAVPGPTIDDALLIARQNKLLAPVRRRLAEVGMVEPSPAETAAVMMTNSALLQELVAFVPHLEAAGLEVLVIKGPVQQKLIHGSFFQRPAADLDILVRASDFPRARQLLVEQGYRLATPSLWWRSMLGEEHFHKRAIPHLAIDLHHRVHQPGAPAPYDAGQMFVATETVRFAGIDIPTLNAANAMLLCTISIAKALYNREPSAAYLHDLYVWFMAATPEAVNCFLRTARASGLGGHATLAFTLMDALFDSHSVAATGIDAARLSISPADLLRIILVPRDPLTRWPRRRDMLWELCERRPARYGREFARVLGSELTRRLFERGAAA